MVLAALVAFAPNGGNFADAVFAALTLAFLAAITWMLYTLSRQNELTLAALSDGRRAILYAALAMIALLIAGTEKLWDTGGGTLLWIVLLAVSVAAIWRIWMETTTY